MNAGAWPYYGQLDVSMKCEQRVLWARRRKVEQALALGHALHMCLERTALRLLSGFMSIEELSSQQV